MVYKFRWVIAVLLTSAVLLVFASLLWFFMAIRPADPHASQVVSYDFKSGASVGSLASDLKDAGIIKNATAFTLLVAMKGLRADLQAGTYEFNPNNNASEIARQLAEGRIAVNKLVVPEGADIAKIKELASDAGISPGQFNEALKANYTSNFLAARPAGYASLEGYLFPDSYQVAKPPRPQAVVQMMLDTFAAKVSKADLVKSFAAQGLNLHQGLTLASIVEKEVSNPADRPMVAGVFFNRLKRGQRLETDPTIDYAAKLMGKPFSLSLDSPYNTYRNGGLPPGPICSPGLSAMQAVGNPAKHDYYYFLSDKQGKTHYSKTLEEHIANIKRYLSN
jgi:UPF0755 protein